MVIHWTAFDVKRLFSIPSTVLVLIYYLLNWFESSWYMQTFDITITKISLHDFQNRRICVYIVCKYVSFLAFWIIFKKSYYIQKDIPRYIILVHNSYLYTAHFLFILRFIFISKMYTFYIKRTEIYAHYSSASKSFIPNKAFIRGAFLKKVQFRNFGVVALRSTASAWCVPPSLISCSRYYGSIPSC